MTVKTTLAIRTARADADIVPTQSHRIRMLDGKFNGKLQKLMKAETTPAPQKTLAALADKYSRVRRQTGALCAPLKTEDYVIQSMEDVSPTKWHLAHTTWFFETFVLAKYDISYEPRNPDYAYLFNSYYVQAGERFSRPHRGLLSRPGVEEVFAYREYVDEHMFRFLNSPVALEHPDVLHVLEIGLNHEQQHQELLITDVKHVLSVNPLHPAYCAGTSVPVSEPLDMDWVAVPEGIARIGHDGPGFSYDNEGPAHRVFLEGYEMATRPVTNAEYLAFVDDEAYHNPVLWLSEGWATVEREGWMHPLYWKRTDHGWQEFTMGGLKNMDMHAPATHLSYFEADAFVRWAGWRLPTEFEWEHVSEDRTLNGHFSDERLFHPQISSKYAPAGSFHNLFGSAWEWTGSHYSPYPGYRAAPGALGEYNGKFMYNQFVLRGGSVATPSDHIRATYRNFFPGYARWQFSAIRPAR